MPELITFHGRPVKRRRRIPQGVRLIFVSPMLGEPGEVAVVSQEDWSRYGRIQFLPNDLMPNLRALARRFTS